MKLTNNYIKQCIGEMIEERNRLALVDPEVKPSHYWQSFCDRIDYIRDLSDEHLLRIREHTYHLTGDNYQTYYFSDPHAFKEANKLDVITGTKLSEPDTGIGFDYVIDGVVYKISNDLIRYMHVMETLRLASVFYPPMYQVAEGEKLNILEIGAGYGGLAYQILNTYRQQVKRYVVIDLPEVLFFAAVFLNNNFDMDIHLYRSGDKKAVSDGGIILLPNYLTNLTEYCTGQFDMVINVASFQEMTMAQVIDYLAMCRRIMKSDGLLYSWNMDRNPASKQPDLNVSDLLKTYFQVTECYAPTTFYEPTVKDRVRNVLKWGAGKVGLVQPVAYTVPEQVYHEYVCRKGN